MKHLAVRQLWLKDQLRDGKLTVAKVRSDLNMADLMTKWFTTVHHQWLTTAIGVGRNKDKS
eukprot:15162027-Heterocapsa_arctica.AAC.1